MKVLWLTNTPVGASKHLGILKTSGGWMSSLETYVKAMEGMELGVCFFFDGSKQFKFHHNEVTYYPVRTKNTNIFNKVRSKLFNSLTDSNPKGLLKVIEDFQPDVIQLFGSESGLGEVLAHTKVPSIIHIQGIINPYLAAWFPKGMTQLSLLAKAPLLHIIRKKGILGEYYTFKKRAKREESIIKSANYFFGRTDWDRRVNAIYNASGQYFHCEELMRKPFFDSEWKPNKSDTLALVTTINPNIYKGLEIILKTSFLLKQKIGLNFKWTILGIDANDPMVRMMEKFGKLTYKNNNVVFAGYQKVEGLISHLLTSDIFVHPSHIDNSPNSICEAMLLGMPVIAGDVGGVPSIINDTVDGILYNSHDPYDLAGRIMESASNQEEMSQLGMNARIRATKRHDVAEILKTIKETYEKMVSENRYVHKVQN